MVSWLGNALQINSVPVKCLKVRLNLCIPDLVYLDDHIIPGQGVPVHADDLHPGAHAPGEHEGVVLLEDGVEGAPNGGGLLGGVAGDLDPEVGVRLVQQPVSVRKVLGNGGDYRHSKCK